MKSNVKLYCVSGKDKAGTLLYHVIEIARAREPIFKKAAQAASIELTQFGRIRYSSTAKPSETILAMLRNGRM